MPIAGGDAKAITTGPAFDSQPRYSPDGKSIAFVSDRDGAENLWVATKDGSDARPLSKDKQVAVRLAVVDARGRLRAGLAAAAASVGSVRRSGCTTSRGGSGIAITKGKTKPDAKPR